MPYPPIYPLPVGAWVWQGCHTLLFTIRNQNNPYNLHIVTTTNNIKNNLFSVHEHTLFDLCQ